MTLSLATPTVGARLRRFAALTASTFAAVSPVLAGPPAAPQAATGTIKGRLVWAAGPVPKPKVEASAAGAKDAVCKTKPIYNKDITVDPETKGVADAFAYLVAPSGDYSATEKALVAKTPAVVVDQVNCEYVPYATVVHKDQKLTFKSTDPVGHNVDFKPFSNPPINPMLPPNGSYPYTIKKAEKRPAAAVCSIHPWMKGWVFITDNPFAVVTKPDGSFEIKDVPAGAQHIIVWQSSKGYVTTGGNKGQEVTVKAGETVDLGEVKITK
jgi:plastocyanin